MSAAPNRVRLTAGRVAEFTCPPGKTQSFLWDTDVTALALRVASGGRKTFMFESRLNGATIRMSIGTADAWSIGAARQKAAALKQQTDAGIDPREVKRQQDAEKEAKRAADAAHAATAREAWDVYVAERRKDRWGERTYTDHIKIAQAGGEPRARRPGTKTAPGPLAPLLALPLRDLTPARVESWATTESKKRPARVRLALRMLKAFLRWCATQDAYKPVADATAASTKKARETAGKPKKRDDVLQREQVATWFAHVRQIGNPTIAAYLQCLLLTGARREELASLRWNDVNFQWDGISMRDKIEGSRFVPLTPYVKSLLSGLPRRNQWVFSSPTAKTGRLTEPSIAHRQACQAAGLAGLTLHGLRRSFATLSEWIEVPAGVAAQIQGHAPQGVRESNYIRRPPDLLRLHHKAIEAWILEQAGITFDASAEPGKLRAVA